MQAHKLIHSGHKPVFQCELCPTTCGRKTDLKYHVMKLHTSDRPLQCRKCGKAFPDRYTYKVQLWLTLVISSVYLYLTELENCTESSHIPMPAPCSITMWPWTSTFWSCDHCMPCACRGLVGGENGNWCEYVARHLLTTIRTMYSHMI